MILPSPPLSARRAAASWLRPAIILALALWGAGLVCALLGWWSMANPPTIALAVPLLVLVGWSCRHAPCRWGASIPLAAPLLAATLAWLPGAWVYWVWQQWMGDPENQLLAAVWWSTHPEARVLHGWLGWVVVASAWIGLACALARSALEGSARFPASAFRAGALACGGLLLAYAAAAAWLGQCWALVALASP